MNEKYNPNNYISEIQKAIESPLRKGLKVQITDNKLNVINTVSGDIASIDLSQWAE